MALGLWWPEAYGGSASCSDVPRLLLGIVETFMLDACQGLCVLEACRDLCSGA
jgi:hypothetical protein